MTITRIWLKLAHLGVYSLLYENRVHFNIDLNIGYLVFQFNSILKGKIDFEDWPNFISKSPDLMKEFMKKNTFLYQIH